MKLVKRIQVKIEYADGSSQNFDSPVGEYDQQHSAETIIDCLFKNIDKLSPGPTIEFSNKS